MWTKNFVKEMFWKNDLTYLCLCLPFIMMMKPVNVITSVVVIGSCLLLAYSWRMSFKKRYIFNSHLKHFILLALALTAFKFLPITDSIVRTVIGVLELVFIAGYSLYVMITAFYLLMNTDEHYAGEYYPEVEDTEDTYRENAYRRSIYSVMRWNNTIEYRYDRNINAYLYYGKLYEDIIHERFYSCVANSGIGFISDLHDYMNYLRENSLAYHKMNADELAVFRMYTI